MTHLSFPRAALLTGALLTGALPALTLAQAPAPAAAPTATASASWSDGEVRKIDREARKLTLRHGEIKNLDMPPMTMVFQVRDTALLETLQVGAKVRFVAAKDGSNYLVTAIEPAR